MTVLRQFQSSRKTLFDLGAHNLPPSAPRIHHALFRRWQRHASSTVHPPNKQIVLEQPDKFRPPSHAQRLVRGRGRPNTFGGGYNQSSTPKEQEAQKTRRYPHTFPNEGTVMHKFLTNRKWHLFITLGTLFCLASISLLMTFQATSPYAHLLPPLSSLVWHPFNFFSECWSVFRLDQDYRTAQAYESRQQNILDAQKRRLYRRAHGMENMNAEYDQGIDVRGIAPWDDGLTKRERESKKADWERKGDVPPEMTTLMVQEKESQQKALQENVEGEPEQPQQPRKRKLWLGIW